jgi:hypothetical protein
MPDATVQFLNSQPFAAEFKALLDGRIDFGKWSFGLIEAGRRQMVDVLLVYESPMCRVRMGYSRGRYSVASERLGEALEEEAFYEYGRLNAPALDDEITIGETAYVAWHDPFELLCYLDYAKGDLSEEDLANVGIVPPAWRVCLDKVAKQEHSGRIDAWAAAIAASWELVGDELFELLDLNRPDLWEAYVAFRKVRWKLIKRKKLETLGDRAQASIDLLAPSYEQEVV